MKRNLFLFTFLCAVLFSAFSENIYAQKYSRRTSYQQSEVFKKRVKGTKKFISPPKYFHGSINLIPEKAYYLQDFENELFPPADWTLANSDSDVTWTRSIEASSYGIGTGSAFINFFDYGSLGETDSLFTPLFTGLQGSDSIKFDAAYGYFEGFYDTLKVLLTVNGGVSYSVIFSKGGDSLKTVTTDEYFVPTPFQWKTWKIALPSSV
ncbi:MAG: choice-of-anchor J domain-containing protein, partial [Bacteroidota bacterium]